MGVASRKARKSGTKATQGNGHKKGHKAGTAMSKAEAEAQRKALKRCTEVSTYEHAKLEDAGNSLSFQVTLDMMRRWSQMPHTQGESSADASRQGERSVRAGAQAQSR